MSTFRWVLAGAAFLAAGLLVTTCSTPQSGADSVRGFLAGYNDSYRELWTGAEGAKWVANVDIREQNRRRRVEADQAMGDYVGSAEVIAQLRRLRARTDLTPPQMRQVEVAWQLAAHYPATAPETVEALIKAEAAQSDALYSFDFILTLPGEQPREVTPNEIVELLASAEDPAQRLAAWECSKSIGPALKDGLIELQRLRNTVAREMGFSSFFGLEVANYGLTSAEMIELMDDLIAGIMPLYEQLHCWAKHELAARFGAEVPRRIPAHWIGNRWAQEWPGIVTGIDLDALFQDKDPRWVLETAEAFYVSLGFPELPASFWQRSDLYELPAGTERKKNSHASAWHIDLDQDVRSLMSVKANYDWFQTTHHELGHIYYYLAYSNPEVPFILRTGANRGFHEGIGTLIELACNQVPYLQEIELLAADEAPDRIRWLLSQALVGPVTFLPFACGTMTHFEHDLYEEDLPADWFNQRWWEYAGKYQGIAPPTPRGEEFCDSVTKTHISDDPAQYYDYAISNVILHQLHRHICREILHEDVHAANYFGSTEVGDFLRDILAVGANCDWRQLMVAATGEPLSSRALLEYFAPLQDWFSKQNAGRDVSFQ